MNTSSFATANSESMLERLRTLREHTQHVLWEVDAEPNMMEVTSPYLRSEANRVGGRRRYKKPSAAPSSSDMNDASSERRRRPQLAAGSPEFFRRALLVAKEGGLPPPSVSSATQPAHSSAMSSSSSSSTSSLASTSNYTTSTSRPPRLKSQSQPPPQRASSPRHNIPQHQQSNIHRSAAATQQHRRRGNDNKGRRDSRSTIETASTATSSTATSSSTSSSSSSTSSSSSFDSDTESNTTVTTATTATSISASRHHGHKSQQQRPGASGMRNKIATHNTHDNDYRHSAHSRAHSREERGSIQRGRYAVLHASTSTLAPEGSTYKPYYSEGSVRRQTPPPPPLPTQRTATTTTRVPMSPSRRASDATTIPLGSPSTSSPSRLFKVPAFAMPIAAFSNHANQYSDSSHDAVTRRAAVYTHLGEGAAIASAVSSASNTRSNSELFVAGNNNAHQSSAMMPSTANLSSIHQNTGIDSSSVLSDGHPARRNSSSSFHHHRTSPYRGDIADPVQEALRSASNNTTTPSHRSQSQQFYVGADHSSNVGGDADDDPYGDHYRSSRTHTIVSRVTGGGVTLISPRWDDSQRNMATNTDDSALPHPQAVPTATTSQNVHVNIVKNSNFSAAVSRADNGNTTAKSAAPSSRPPPDPFERTARGEGQPHHYHAQREGTTAQQHILPSNGAAAVTTEAILERARQTLAATEARQLLTQLMEHLERTQARQEEERAAMNNERWASPRRTADGGDIVGLETNSSMNVPSNFATLRQQQRELAAINKQIAHVKKALEEAEERAMSVVMLSRSVSEAHQPSNVNASSSHHHHNHSRPSLTDMLNSSRPRVDRSRSGMRDVQEDRLRALQAQHASLLNASAARRGGEEAAEAQQSQRQDARPIHSSSAMARAARRREKEMLKLAKAQTKIAEHQARMQQREAKRRRLKREKKDRLRREVEGIIHQINAFREQRRQQKEHARTQRRAAKNNNGGRGHSSASFRNPNGGKYVDIDDEDSDDDGNQKANAEGESDGDDDAPDTPVNYPFFDEDADVSTPTMSDSSSDGEDSVVSSASLNRSEHEGGEEEFAHNDDRFTKLVVNECGRNSNANIAPMVPQIYTPALINPLGDAKRSNGNNHSSSSLVRVGARVDVAAVSSSSTTRTTTTVVRDSRGAEEKKNTLNGSPQRQNGMHSSSRNDLLCGNTSGNHIIVRGGNNSPSPLEKLLALEVQPTVSPIHTKGMDTKGRSQQQHAQQRTSPHHGQRYDRSSSAASSIEGRPAWNSSPNVTAANRKSPTAAAVFSRTNTPHTRADGDGEGMGQDQQGQSVHQAIPDGYVGPILKTMMRGHSPSGSPMRASPVASPTVRKGGNGNGGGGDAHPQQRGATLSDRDGDAAAMGLEDAYGSPKRRCAVGQEGGKNNNITTVPAYHASYSYVTKEARATDPSLLAQSISKQQKEDSRARLSSDAQLALSLATSVRPAAIGSQLMFNEQESEETRVRTNDDDEASPSAAPRRSVSIRIDSTSPKGGASSPVASSSPKRKDAASSPIHQASTSPNRTSSAAANGNGAREESFHLQQTTPTRPDRDGNGRTSPSNAAAGAAGHSSRCATPLPAERPPLAHNNHHNHHHHHDMSRSGTPLPLTTRQGGSGRSVVEEKGGGYASTVIRDDQGEGTHRHYSSPNSPKKKRGDAKGVEAAEDDDAVAISSEDSDDDDHHPDCTHHHYHHSDSNKHPNHHSPNGLSSPARNASVSHHSSVGKEGRGKTSVSRASSANGGRDNKTSAQKKGNGISLDGDLVCERCYKHKKALEAANQNGNNNASSRSSSVQRSQSVLRSTFQFRDAAYPTPNGLQRAASRSRSASAAHHDPQHLADTNGGGITVIDGMTTPARGQRSASASRGVSAFLATSGGKEGSFSSEFVIPTASDLSKHRRDAPPQPQPQGRNQSPARRASSFSSAHHARSASNVSRAVSVQSTVPLPSAAQAPTFASLAHCSPQGLAIQADIDEDSPLAKQLAKRAAAAAEAAQKGRPNSTSATDVKLFVRDGNNAAHVGDPSSSSFSLGTRSASRNHRFVDPSSSTLEDLANAVDISRSDSSVTKGRKASSSSLSIVHTTADGRPMWSPVRASEHDRHPHGSLFSIAGTTFSASSPMAPHNSSSSGKQRDRSAPQRSISASVEDRRSHKRQQAHHKPSSEAPPARPSSTRRQSPTASTSPQKVSPQLQKQRLEFVNRKNSSSPLRKYVPLFTSSVTDGGSDGDAATNLSARKRKSAENGKRSISEFEDDDIEANSHPPPRPISVTRKRYDAPTASSVVRAALTAADLNYTVPLPPPPPAIKRAPKTLKNANNSDAYVEPSPSSRSPSKKRISAEESVAAKRRSAVEQSLIPPLRRGGTVLPPALFDSEQQQAHAHQERHGQRQQQQRRSSTKAKRVGRKVADSEGGSESVDENHRARPADESHRPTMHSTPIVFEDADGDDDAESPQAGGVSDDDAYLVDAISDVTESVPANSRGQSAAQFADHGDEDERENEENGDDEESLAPTQSTIDGADAYGDEEGSDAAGAFEGGGGTVPLPQLPANLLDAIAVAGGGEAIDSDDEGKDQMHADDDDEDKDDSGGDEHEDEESADEAGAGSRVRRSPRSSPERRKRPSSLSASSPPAARKKKKSAIPARSMAADSLSPPPMAPKNRQSKLAEEAAVNGGDGSSSVNSNTKKKVKARRSAYTSAASTTTRTAASTAASALRRRGRGRSGGTASVDRSHSASSANLNLTPPASALDLQHHRAQIALARIKKDQYQLNNRKQIVSQRLFEERDARLAEFRRELERRRAEQQ